MPLPLADSPLVFGSVGTDYHPFHRMIEWIDSWLDDGGRLVARAVIQSGTSKPSRRAESISYLAFDDLQTYIRLATTLVSHGGPATVMDCCRLGIKPIVIPRLSRFGEHVDNHQVAFARMMASQGLIEVADTEEQFRSLVDRSLTDPTAFRQPVPIADLRETVARFERWVAELIEPRHV